MKRKIFTLFVFMATFCLAYSQMTIQVASKPATIDGVIDASDPWVEADWVVPAKASAGSTTTDMSAKFQLKYDAVNLYFAAVVTDASRFIGNTTAHLNDCVEFFIAMDTTSGTAGTYKLGDNQFRLQAAEDATVGNGGGLQRTPENLVVKCVDNGGDYVQEWKLPWAELALDLDPAWDQKQFKFDVQVADATADGARTQQMFWNDNSDLQWNNTTKFGIATLAVPIYEPNNAAKLTIEVAPKPVVADGIIDANDPWIEANWLVPDKASAGSTTTAMSAKFQLMYDKTNLYFGAQVIDASRFVGNTTAHLNDCVEFFIAMDTTSGTAGTYKLGDNQLRLQAAEDATVGNGGGLQRTPAGGVFKCIDNGGDYVQEWILPWADLALDLDPVWDQKQFKLDVQVADATADGARTQQMFWNDNSDLQWNNTTKFAVVALRTPVSLLPASTGIKNVKASKSLIYVDQNMQLQRVSGLVCVYDITGKLMIKSYAKTGSISVAFLKQGIYIVHTNNSATKISIR
jgi:hypothetical protein